MQPPHRMRRRSAALLSLALFAGTSVGFIGYPAAPAIAQDGDRLPRSKRFSRAGGAGTSNTTPPGSSNFSLPAYIPPSTVTPRTVAPAVATPSAPASAVPGAAAIPAVTAPAPTPAAPAQATSAPAPAAVTPAVIAPASTVVPAAAVPPQTPAAGEQAHKATAESINATGVTQCAPSVGIWNYSRLPLSVYVYPVAAGVTKYKPQYPGLVTQAFEEWTTATRGTFKFKFVNQLPADITVQFLNATRTGAAGATTNNSFNHELVKSQVQLALNPRSNDRDALRLVEHEIGHVLGLGHSARTLGIMAPVLANSEAVTISEGEYNDLKRLYALGDDGRPAKVEASQFDAYKKTIAAHLISRLKTMPRPLNRPCDVSLDLDRTGFMFSYNLNSNKADHAPDIIAAIMRSRPFPASQNHFTGKIRLKFTINPDLSIAAEEVHKL